MNSSVFYPELGNETFFDVEDKSFWYHHRNNCIIEVINKYFSNGSIFDIGGGNGYVSKSIQDAGFNVVLIEPDIKGVLNAKQRGINNLICSSFFDLEWAEDKLDNVGIFDVLEHIQDDIDFINSIGCRMKSGGLLFLTVPSHNFLYSMEDKHDGHFRRYSMSELKSKLSLCGFELLFSTYIFSYLLFPIYFFKVIPSRFNIGKFKSLEKYSSQQRSSDYQSEHEVKNGFLQQILKWLHNIEINKIVKGSSIKYGATCLIVAKKIK